MIPQNVTVFESREVDRENEGGYPEGRYMPASGSSGPGADIENNTEETTRGNTSVQRLTSPKGQDKQENVESE